MEKLLLIMALLGSALLAVRGMGKVGKLVLAFAVPPAGSVRNVVRMPEAKQMAVSNEDGEDWSQYDIPTFIRRGKPMPAPEPAPATETKTRKRRSKAKPESAATSAPSDKASFEVLA